MLINENIMNNEGILKLLLNYVTIRLDIINVSNTEENTIEIIENSDSNSNVSFPKWFKKKNQPQGIVVTSSNLSLDLKINCLTDGDLKIKLRALDIKGKNKERFPICVDVNRFLINEEIILRKHNLISFSNANNFSKKVEKDEIVTIHLEWMPLNRQCEYKNPTIPLKNQIKELTDDLEFIKSNDNSSLINLELKKYGEKLSNLKKEFDEYKQDNDKYLDSVHFLLDDLYINHEQKPVGYLSRLQEVNVEILTYLDNVCKKYDLEWWLDYGNLIGAVRHEGSVPWDDDTDIGMMRTDYIKLYDVLSNEIKENNLEDIIELYFRTRNVNYRRADSFLQIKFYSDVNISERKILLANIDVFPYDYIRSYEKRTLDELYFNTKIDYFNNLINEMDPEECFKIMYDKLNLTFDKTDLVIPGVEGTCGLDNTYSLSVFDADKIFPLSKIKYSNKMFPCPNDIHYYLKKIYGDYLSLPKNLRRHKRAQKFRYIENNQLFYINLLKTIRDLNSKF